jgi:hypothetical protein
VGSSEEPNTHCLKRWWIVPSFVLCSVFGAAQIPYVQEQYQSFRAPSVDFQSRALVFSVPVVGTTFRLTYRSDIPSPKWRLNVYNTYDPLGGILWLGEGRPRRATPVSDLPQKALPWLAIGEMAIVAPNGNELFIFDENGKPLRTLSSISGALVYRFSHNAAGNY